MAEYYGPESSRIRQDKLPQQQQSQAANSATAPVVADDKPPVENFNDILNEYDDLKANVRANNNSILIHVRRFKSELFGNPGQRGDTGGLITALNQELKLTMFTRTDMGMNMEEACKKIYELDNWNTWYVVKLEESFKKYDSLLQKCFQYVIRQKKFIIEQKKRVAYLQTRLQQYTTTPTTASSNSASTSQQPPSKNRQPTQSGDEDERGETMDEFGR